MSAEGSSLIADFRCTCAGPMVNTHVDGNAGHSPGCAANPNTWPEVLRVCDSCGIPFSKPVTPEQAFAVFPSFDVAGFTCEGCGGEPL